MILEFNGFSRATGDTSANNEGDELLEVWTGPVDFNEVARGTYFRTGGQESCLSIEWVDGKFVYALNDEYLDIPPTDTLPTDEELYAMLEGLVNG